MSLSLITFGVAKDFHDFRQNSTFSRNGLKYPIALFPYPFYPPNFDLEDQIMVLGIPNLTLISKFKILGQS